MSHNSETVLITLCWVGAILFVAVIVSITVVRASRSVPERVFDHARNQYHCDVRELSEKLTRCERERDEVQGRLVEAQFALVKSIEVGDDLRSENHELRAAIRRWEEQS